MLELEQAKKKTEEVSHEAAQKLLEVQQDKHTTLRTGCVTFGVHQISARQPHAVPLESGTLGSTGPP